MKIDKILCAVNDDPLADSIFELAYDLSQKLGAEFALVSILDPALLQPGESGYTVYDLRTSCQQEVRRLFDRLLQKRGSPQVATFSEEGDPKKHIVAIANEWKADLIIIASHGRTGVSRALMGSVAESVLRHSKCPVLVVPARS